MTFNTLADLSKTAASNTDFLGTDATGSGNANDIDTVRQNLAAMLARNYDDQGGVVTVGGTGNAITVASNSTYQTLRAGLQLVIKASAANTTAVTLNLDSLGAKAVRMQGDVALTGGEMLANGYYEFVYDDAYNAANGAWVLKNPATGTSTFSDSAFRLQDNGDATKQLAFEVSGITAGQTRTLTPPNASATIAALDVEDQTLTGGARVTSKSLGTVSSGTLTLDPGDRPLQHYTNGGAHTLAPGSNGGSILLDITNNASAGAITTSGWTKVVGSFTTTSGHKFRCSASVGNGGSLLTIQALQ